MRRKRARGRLPVQPSNPTSWSPNALRWAHCEWFVSWLDAPFFECSEFNEVLESMGLFPDGGIATRAEWGRLRAAMCNAFEAYAAPRRLSRSYLQMERRDLELYRADARAAMRGKRLPAANDPVSGAPFKPEWYARYRHPPPYVPEIDAKLIIRYGTQLRPATFVSLAEGYRNGNSNGNGNSAHIHSYTNQLVRVRFSDTNQVAEVPDLDVMLREEPLIPHCASDAIPNAADVAMDEGSNAVSLNAGLRTPPGTRRVSFVSAPNTPLLVGVGNNNTNHHHQNRRGSIFNPLVSLSPRSNGTPNNSNNNPDDEDTGHHHQTNHQNSPGNVMEAEVNVGRLASLMRLVERRQEIVETLRRANDTGEEEARMTGSVTNATRNMIESSVAMLADLSARSEQLLPQAENAETEAQEEEDVPREASFTLPQIQPSPSHPQHPQMQVQPSPQTAPSPSLSPPFETQHQPNSSTHQQRVVVQKLEDVFTDVLAQPNIPPTPPQPSSSAGAALSGMSPRTNTAYPTNNININMNMSNNVNINLNNNHNNNNISSPSPEIVTATRGIDSSSAEGSIAYGKAITKACLSKYGKFSKINDMPEQHRSDVIDCVAVCVALLHRARATKDPGAIDELVGILKGRFPNFPDTIHNANVELRRRIQQQQNNTQGYSNRKQQFQGNHQQLQQIHHCNSTSQASSAAAGTSAAMKARSLQ